MDAETLLSRPSPPGLQPAALAARRVHLASVLERARTVVRGGTRAEAETVLVDLMGACAQVRWS